VNAFTGFITVVFMPRSVTQARPRSPHQTVSGR